MKSGNKQKRHYDHDDEIENYDSNDGNNEDGDGSGGESDGVDSGRGNGGNGGDGGGTWNWWKLNSRSLSLAVMESLAFKRAKSQEIPQFFMQVRRGQAAAEEERKEGWKTQLDLIRGQFQLDMKNPSLRSEL